MSLTFFRDILKNQADALVSKFYCKPGLLRSIFQDIINDTESFLLDGSFMNALKQKVVNSLMHHKLIHR